MDHFILLWGIFLWRLSSCKVVFFSNYSQQHKSWHAVIQLLQGKEVEVVEWVKHDWFCPELPLPVSENAGTALAFPCYRCITLLPVTVRYPSSSPSRTNTFRAEVLTNPSNPSNLRSRSESQRMHVKGTEFVPSYPLIVHENAGTDNSLGLLNSCTLNKHLPWKEHELATSIV